MTRLARDTEWTIQCRMKASSGIGARTNVGNMRARFVTALAQRASGTVRLAQRDGNPHGNVVDRDVLFASDSTINLSSVLVSDAEWDTADAAWAYFLAVKESGNEGFSVDRFMQKLGSRADGCSAVDNFGIFHRGEAVYEVCVEYSRAPANTQTPPPRTTLADSTVASFGNSTVRDSTRREEIGTRTQPLSDRVPKAAVDLWGSIPTEVKVAAGAITVLAGLIGLAYVLRTGKVVMG